jgi:hypothetical protein
MVVPALLEVDRELLPEAGTVICSLGPGMSVALAREAKPEESRIPALRIKIARFMVKPSN